MSTCCRSWQCAEALSSRYQGCGRQSLAKMRGRANRDLRKKPAVAGFLVRDSIGIRAFIEVRLKVCVIILTGFYFDIMVFRKFKFRKSKLHCRVVPTGLYSCRKWNETFHHPYQYNSFYVPVLELMRIIQ